MFNEVENSTTFNDPNYELHNFTDCVVAVSHVAMHLIGQRKLADWD